MKDLDEKLDQYVQGEKKDDSDDDFCGGVAWIICTNKLYLNLIKLYIFKEGLFIIIIC